MYEKSALETIRNVPGKGRPKGGGSLSDLMEVIENGTAVEIIEKEILYREHYRIYLDSSEKMIVTGASRKGNFRFEHKTVYENLIANRPYHIMKKMLANRLINGEINDEDIKLIKKVVDNTMETFDKRIEKIMESIGFIWKGTEQLETLEKELKLRGITIPWKTKEKPTAPKPKPTTKAKKTRKNADK